MYQRQYTPPGTSVPDTIQPGSATSVHSRTASDGSYDISPISVQTHLTTPERSPIRSYGPMLLPRPRDQDQVHEPKAGPILSTSGGHGWAPYASRPSLERRGTSPPCNVSLLSPASDSPIDLSITSTLNSPLSFATASRRTSLPPHSRSSSSSRVNTHSRSPSNSSIDGEGIRRFAYPTYRTTPDGRTSANQSFSAHALSHLTPLTSSATPSIPAPTALSHLNPLSSSALNIVPPQYYQRSRSNTPQPQPVMDPQITIQLDQNFDVMAPTTSLLDYLTERNPAPAIVKQPQPFGWKSVYFWWDVRNVRTWNEFNVESMCAIPSILPLLNAAVADKMLPSSHRYPTNPMPQNEHQLQEIWRDHHAHKVNAALNVSLGEHHLTMRSNIEKSSQTRQLPDFISNYATNDDLKREIPLLYGEELPSSRRGCVVGLVKAYNVWNSGMRHGDPNAKVQYLLGLAHLQYLMREHGTRYGYIMTETELVCVRYGGDPSVRAKAMGDNDVVGGGEHTPVFGYFEVAKPIEMRTHGRIPGPQCSNARFNPQPFDVFTDAGFPAGPTPSTGDDIEMTASLALWYLHMLAKEIPLRGQLGAKLDVGTPMARTRAICLDKDEWIPKVTNKREVREATNNRGWVWPEDKLGKFEKASRGRGKR
ncbi:MAG: hypothetical protein M1820_007405 [Bogoriella megaspora]|nr:MAG: hypothetical protein M1820_007405 [Bogoriella megaspora]